MAEPKKKSTRSSRGQRLHSQKKTNLNIIACAKCGSQIKSHTVCDTCGYYAGKKIIETSLPSQTKVKTKVTKK